MPAAICRRLTVRVSSGWSAHMRMHLRHGSGPNSHRVECCTGNNTPRTPTPMAIIGYGFRKNNFHEMPP